jgi:hypothetical protein
MLSGVNTACNSEWNMACNSPRVSFRVKHTCHSERSEESAAGAVVESYQPVAKSSHVGFAFSINATFLSRRQPLISFSRAMAAWM